jgi:hypothetical protein
MRIFERGNEQEMQEIIRFYGKKETKTVLMQLKGRSVSIDNKLNKIVCEEYD